MIGERPTSRAAGRTRPALAGDLALQALERPLHVALRDPVAPLDRPHRALLLERRDSAPVALVEAADRRVIEPALKAAVEALVDRELLTRASLIERVTAGLSRGLSLQPLLVEVVDEVARRGDHPGRRILDLPVRGPEVANERLRGDVLGRVARSGGHLAELLAARDRLLDARAQRREILVGQRRQLAELNVRGASPRGPHRSSALSSSSHSSSGPSDARR